MGYGLSTLRGDVFGGITAAWRPCRWRWPLASQPGLACPGLYGAIAVGFFAAIFGGTPAQVSGPTGPMTVVMAAIVAQYADSLQTAFTIVFLARALQVLFGALRLGRFISYTPYSVISGFMSGIGAIIIIIQLLLPFIGADTAPGGPTGAIAALPAALGAVNNHAALIAAISLGLMIFWPRRLAALVPAPLVALIVGTGLSLTLLPGAGATMRTVVNVRTGGRTPVSGALHALILLSLVLGLGPYAEVIPNAVLAGILMKVGWDIIDWGYLKRIRYAPRDKVAVMFVTLGLTVFVDLITAVAVGLIVAGFVTAKWMEEEEMKGITTLALPEDDTLETLAPEARARLDQFGGDVLLIRMRGRFSYASARALTRQLGAQVAGYQVVVLDFEHAAMIDTSAAMAIDELLSSLGEQKVRFLLVGLRGRAQKTLASLGVLDGVDADDITADLATAIDRVEHHLQHTAA
ncbi:MAG TPA: SulP family inorganic anion transporter [Aliiroseovarius sp.]|nr:SulP family inorganic anion transporter [Aliiroseovarius sp.]